VLTKLDRVTRHFDQVVDVNVLLTVEKKKEKERRQNAEVTLHVKGRDIFVEHSSEDMYAAIDQLMDKLDRQVVRHKDRLQDHHHHRQAAGRARLTPSGNVATTALRGRFAWCRRRRAAVAAMPQSVHISPRTGCMGHRGAGARFL
jgi:putative sigma-54 modulation protein